MLRIEPEGETISSALKRIVKFVARVVFKVIAIANKECDWGGTFRVRKIEQMYASSRDRETYHLGVVLMESLALDVSVCLVVKL